MRLFLLLCAFRGNLETALDALRGLSPSLVKQLMPIFDQLTPIYMDVAQVSTAGQLPHLYQVAFHPLPMQHGNICEQVILAAEPTCTMYH